MLDWATWARLWVAPSSYLMLLTLVATICAKTMAALELAGSSTARVLPLVSLSDVLVYLGVAGVLALGESRWKRAAWATTPIAGFVGSLGLVNALYLALAGEQGSVSALNGAIEQAGDIEMVLSNLVSPTIAIGSVGGLLVVVAVPVLMAKLVHRVRGSLDHRDHGRGRTMCAWSLAVPAGLAMLALPGPDSVDARALARNAWVNVLRTTTIRFKQGTFAGYPQKRLVDARHVTSLAASPRPNVLVVFLESTRYDHTSLAPKAIRGAETPRLAELAARGVVAHTVRAVLPHTTKSMFSMLCGRMPTMQRGVVEISADPDLQCVPDIVREAGYRTMFVQSAFGTFEQRARLVEKFGFEAFKAWEDIRGPILGYLASADDTVVEPLIEWLDSTDPGRPFFATVLTSAPHHPYGLSKETRDRAKESGRPQATIKQRYARLIEEEDRVLGMLLSALDTRGLLDNTIVLAVGDHGEGFGDHGVRQHDNNYFEEGLRVPFVLAGPGIDAGEVQGNVSLIDVAPTLLARLGLPMSSKQRDLLGRDVLDREYDTRGVPRFFGCYSPMRCRGFVLDDHKLVYVPETDEIWAFDLVADPDEREPQVPHEQLWSHVSRMNELIDGHRVKKWKYEHGLVRYGDWVCAKKQGRCRHPHAKAKKYRTRSAARGRAKGSGPARDRAKGSGPARDKGRAPRVAPAGSPAEPAASPVELGDGGAEPVGSQAKPAGGKPAPAAAEGAAASGAAAGGSGTKPNK